MKSKENLIFLGMMGSGKSSIGLLIAKKLRLNFIDVDKEIEKELGISYPTVKKNLDEVIVHLGYQVDEEEKNKKDEIFMKLEKGEITPQYPTPVSSRRFLRDVF